MNRCCQHQTTDPLNVTFIIRAACHCNKHCLITAFFLLVITNCVMKRLCSVGSVAARSTLTLSVHLHGKWWHLVLSRWSLFRMKWYTSGKLSSHSVNEIELKLNWLFALKCIRQHYFSIIIKVKMCFYLFKIFQDLLMKLNIYIIISFLFTLLQYLTVFNSVCFVVFSICSVVFELKLIRAHLLYK